jgi:hypothetical protein
LLKVKSLRIVETFRRHENYKIIVSERIYDSSVTFLGLRFKKKRGDQVPIDNPLFNDDLVEAYTL